MHNKREDLDIVIHEAAELHARWKLFTGLFRDESVAILNTIAPSAFSMIHDALFDSIVLGVRRILMETDRSNDKKTVTLNTIVADEQLDGPLKSELKQCLSDLDRATKPMLIHRNQRIAHLNAGVAGSVEAKKVSKLPEVTRQSIDEALKGIGYIINKVSIGMRDTQVALDHVLVQGNGETIVEALRTAIRLRELQAMARRGVPSDQIVDSLERGI